MIPGASGIPGISGGLDMGGGSISPSSSASSSNKGGNNSLGGFSFGNYNKTDYTPFIIGGVVLFGLWYMTKGGKR